MRPAAQDITEKCPSRLLHRNFSGMPRRDQPLLYINHLLSAPNSGYTLAH